MKIVIKKPTNHLINVNFQAFSRGKMVKKEDYPSVTKVGLSKYLS
jgi:hypothetical protein